MFLLLLALLQCCLPGDSCRSCLPSSLDEPRRIRWVAQERESDELEVMRQEGERKRGICGWYVGQQVGEVVVINYYIYGS